MRKVIDNIEIKEPPMEELGKKHSCLRRTCATSCGCAIMIIIVSLILLKVTLGPKTKELKDIPPTFAEHIPLYDTESIDRVQITEGGERNKAAEYIAFLPKLFISPVVLTLDKGNSLIQSNESISVTAQEKVQSLWERFVTFMKTPVADHRDIYTVEWKQLSADADFIEEYYRREFERSGFGTGVTTKTQTVQQFLFSKNDIDGVVYIRDYPNTPETDFVQITVTVDGSTLR